VPWAMVFPDAGPWPRHPSQLYEALLEGLLLFALLFWLTHRRRALQQPGLLAGVFLTGYGLARSFSELFREPDPGHLFTVGPLTAGIVYSLPMIIAGILIARAAMRRSPRTAVIQPSHAER
jgi:phosphatidylglycerol---prolipoprotein diacylglyceryl transferase